MKTLLIQHGIWMAVYGIIVGIPFLKAIKKKRTNEEQWRIAHIAGILGGILQIAVGLSLELFQVSVNIITIMGGSLIVSNWLFLIGMFISGLSGERGLSSKVKTWSGRSIFICYSLAALLSTVAAILLAYCACYI